MTQPDPRLEPLREAIKLVRKSPSSREVKDPIEAKIVQAAGAMQLLVEDLTEEQGRVFEQGIKLRKLEEERVGWKDLLQLIFDVKHRVRTGAELLEYVAANYREPIACTIDEELIK